jgi:hypothetical protein
MYSVFGRPSIGNLAAVDVAAVITEAKLSKVHMNRRNGHRRESIGINEFRQRSLLDRSMEAAIATTVVNDAAVPHMYSTMSMTAPTNNLASPRRELLLWKCLGVLAPYRDTPAHDSDLRQSIIAE